MEAQQCKEQSSSPFSSGQIGLQILRVYRHLYKMGYSSDNAIHTHQRDTAVEVKALNFCHIRDWVAERSIWPERSDDYSRKQTALQSSHARNPFTYGMNTAMTQECFIILNKLNHIQIYNTQQDRKHCMLAPHPA